MSTISGNARTNPVGQNIYTEEKSYGDTMYVQRINLWNSVCTEGQLYWYMTYVHRASQVRHNVCTGD